MINKPALDKILNMHSFRLLSVSGTSKGLSSSDAELGRADEPSFWSLSVWGKLIDAVDGLPGHSLQQLPSQRHVAKPFSYYLKHLALTVTGDESQREVEVVWTKANHKGEQRDRFHFR